MSPSCRRQRAHVSKETTGGLSLLSRQTGRAPKRSSPSVPQRRRKSRAFSTSHITCECIQNPYIRILSRGSLHSSFRGSVRSFCRRSRCVQPSHRINRGGPATAHGGKQRCGASPGHSWFTASTVPWPGRNHQCSRSAWRPGHGLGMFSWRILSATAAATWPPTSAADG